MTPETITLSAGVISANGRPLLKFESTRWAYVWLVSHGWVPKDLAEGQTYVFAR